MSKRFPFGDLPTFPGPLEMGARGSGVLQLQELLFLSGFPVSLDGYFGEATRNALRALCNRDRLDEDVWKVLMLQFEHALRVISPGETLQETALSYAKRHLRSGARPLNGNTGPWVRLYMSGEEGENYNWCAGFVSFCIAQARESFSTPVQGDLFNKFPYALDCDSIGHWAREQGALIIDRTTCVIHPGSVFLEGCTDFDLETNWHYIHTGFVDEYWVDSFTSIEGSVSDRVYAKYRAFGSRPVHFIDPLAVKEYA